MISVSPDYFIISRSRYSCTIDEGHLDRDFFDGCTGRLPKMVAFEIGDSLFVLILTVFVLILTVNVP